MEYITMEGLLYSYFLHLLHKCIRRTPLSNTSYLEWITVQAIASKPHVVLREASIRNEHAWVEIKVVFLHMIYR